MHIEYIIKQKYKVQSATEQVSIPIIDGVLLFPHSIDVKIRSEKHVNTTSILST